MAVTWGAVGTGGSGTTSCTPSYPTGISSATSKLFCVVTGRSNTADTAPTMPAGWTKVLDFEGGTGTWGVDTGTRRVTIFQKDTVDGTESGTVTVSLSGTTANTLRATIHRLEVPSGYGVDLAASSGADTTNGTGYSATGSSNIDFAADDLLLIVVAQNIDTGTQSAQSITASGITFGTRTNRASTAVTNGNDHRHIVDTVPVSSGSGSVAPTYAYTISASGSGPTGFLRVREVGPPTITAQPTDQSAVDGGTATFTSSATGATSSQWKERIIASGSASILGVSTLSPATSASQTLNLPTSFSGSAIPAGANAAVVLGGYYDSLAGGITALSGTCFTPSATGGAIRNQDNAGSTMSTYAQAFKVVASGGTETVTLTRSDTFNEGPTMHVVWLDVADPDDFIEDYETATGTSTALSITLSTPGESIAFAMYGKDINNTLTEPDAGSTTVTQIGTTSTSADGKDSAMIVTPDTIGDPTTTITASSSIAFPFLIGFTIKGGGTTWENVTGETDDSLVLSGLTLADDGRVFRNDYTGPGGTTSTDQATLTVTDGLLTFQSEVTGGVSTPNTACTVSSLTTTPALKEFIVIGAGVISGSAPTLSTPTGWVKRAEETDLPLAGVVNTTLAVFERTTGDPNTTVGFTASAASLWGYTRFSYDDPNATVFAQATLGHLTATTSPVLPGLTTTKTNAKLINWISQGIAQGGDAPGSMTMRVEDEAGGICMSDEEIADIGATGTRTWTLPSSADMIYAVIELHSASSEEAGGATNLVTQDSTHGHTADNLTLTTATTLSIADCTHGHTADALTLSTGTSLVVSEASHAHTADALTLSTGTSLTVAEASHAHTADSLGLTTDSTLAVADASHGHTAENLTLGTTTGTNLTIAGALHAHSADDLDLTQQTTLAVAEALHAHAADSPTLSTLQSLSIADASHAHGADNLDLSGLPTLSIADAAHAHAADSANLTIDTALSIAEALHAHTAEQIVVSTGTGLAVSEATHAHAADNLALSIAPSLLIAEALHGHAADGLDLTLDAWLAVQDAWHEHRVDSLTLSEDSIYTRAPAGGGYRRAQAVTARPAQVAASGRLNRTSNTTRPRR